MTRLSRATSLLSGLRFALLYVALASGANSVAASPLDRQTILDMRTGEMRKLAVYKTPIELPVYALVDMDNNDHSMDEFKGKYVLVNFWATWCAPCRKEMPSLDALQKKLRSDNFEVVLIATGRNPPPAIRKFFKEAKLNSLTTLRDPTHQLANMLGIYGLPISIILNPEGKEMARMQGDANWNSPEAVAFLQALIAGTDG